MGLIDLPRLAKNKKADVALILEGTYPFIHGGVSSWIHQIICGLPKVQFALIFIGDRKQNYPQLKYDLPDNVVHLSCFYIMEQAKPPKPKARKGNSKAFTQIKALHNSFQCPHSRDLSSMIGPALNCFTSLKIIAYKDFLYSEEAWSFITDRYQQHTGNSSFLSYFWTVRALHTPIFALIDILDKIPDACVYHTISTGYAGLLSVMIHHTKNAPIILTEHGIYTKERKIELSQVDWIKDIQESFGSGLSEDLSYLRQLWIRFFETVGKLTYSAADPIITLTEGNRNRQIADGADASKITVISNGIDLELYKSAKESRPEKPPLIVGFIGRVVPIKDVKTFIRSMRVVSDQCPDAKGWIIGGEDEVPEYAAECRDLVNSLDLESTVIYKGFCNVADIMPELGVVALSSISEGLPLVILESFASGRPVVATDVGACRELIEGGNEQDRALGKSGAIVNIADSESLADEITRLLTNSDYWHQACNSAEKRVKKYYNQESLFDNYRRIYANALEKSWRA